MILLTTIQEKLYKEVGYENVYKNFDCRYLRSWFKNHPKCFPKFMLQNKYTMEFNWGKTRWEINKKL